MSIWLKVTAHFSATPEDWSRVVEVFAAQGLDGTLQTDRPATLSGYLWEPDPDSVASLRGALLATGATDVTTQALRDEDWQSTWKQFFVPRKVGERFVIRPTWEALDLVDGELHIMLDPGQAFGTGDHPTTRMCLELLELVPIRGARVADIGCGSGILAIGARLLGASEVLAVDFESQAIQVTRHNATLNGVRVDAFEGDGFGPLPAGGFDVVLSNIISAALIRLAPEASLRVSSGGCWVVSGIIEPNWPDVAKAARDADFTLHQVLREGEWVAAAFRR